MMQRTESKVITVAPGQENVKIKQMEMFGWNLRYSKVTKCGR